MDAKRQSSTPSGDTPFQVISHLVPVPPFREYPTAIINEQVAVKVAVKQYIPRSTTVVADGTAPITIVAAGALGIVKEAYEPLFEKILEYLARRGQPIRSIWIADMFNVGESAMANKDNLGCDPAWIDHARDLWGIISRFSEEMIKPIAGLGHSFGCNQLLCLSSWHPSFFHSFAFIEPGLDKQYGRGLTIPWAIQTLRQRDTFTSRQEAEDSIVALNNAGSWDSQVLSRLKKYSIALDQTRSDETWVSTTPKDQIAALVSRFNPELLGLGPLGLKGFTASQKELVPDSDPEAFNLGPFYRHELRLAWDMLPNMRPWVLYVNGSNSPFFGHPETREERARITGLGVGGNGGKALGAVKQVVIAGGEHTMVFNQDMACVAEHVGEWLVAESRRWVAGFQRRREVWLRKDTQEKQTVSKEFEASLVLELKRLRRENKL